MVTNGRLIALEGLQPLSAEDFQLLKQYASSAQLAKQVQGSQHTDKCLGRKVEVEKSIPDSA